MKFVSTACVLPFWRLFVWQDLFRRGCGEQVRLKKEAAEMNLMAVPVPEIVYIQCRLCLKLINNTHRNVRVNHMLSHMEIRPYKCIHCGFRSFRRDHARKHMQKHSEWTPTDQPILLMDQAEWAEIKRKRMMECYGACWWHGNMMLRYCTRFSVVSLHRSVGKIPGRNSWNGFYIVAVPRVKIIDYVVFLYLLSRSLASGI